MYEKIDFRLLKEVASSHQENAVITFYLNELCSNILKSCKNEDVLEFLNYLGTFKSGNEYKEPEISEAAITEEDIVEALKEIGVKDPEKVLKDCKKVVDENRSIIEKSHLQNREEALLIISYTHEDKINKTSPYRIINKKLRERDIQDQLTNKKSYLCLLLRALRKLPRAKPQTLYRGIKYDEHEYEIGETIKWKGFSSTSTSMRATQAFLKIKGKVDRTLFEIKNCRGYDIHDFSDYADEEGKIKANTNIELFSHSVAC